ncbi:MAG: Rieske (2Fe-2S) protein, partial [Nitrososphaera sp.]
VFPDQLDIVREIESDRPDIAEKTLFLVPGEEFVDAHLWKHTDLESPRLYPYIEKEQYIAAYRERRKDVCAFDWGDSPHDDVLLTHFRKMATISPYIAKSIEREITFIIKGRASETVLTVDFSTGTVQKDLGTNPLYVLTAPASSVMAVLDGKATWDDIFLSCRIIFDERGKRFIPHYKPLMRYMDSAMLRKLEHYEKILTGLGEDITMIEVTFGKEIFRIQRFCPHAGLDLKANGRINEDGTITCLGHRFNLRTGECVNAHHYSLKVMKTEVV